MCLNGSVWTVPVRLQDRASTCELTKGLRGDKSSGERLWYNFVGRAEGQNKFNKSRTNALTAAKCSDHLDTLENLICAIQQEDRLSKDGRFFWREFLARVHNLWTIRHSLLAQIQKNGDFKSLICMRSVYEVRPENWFIEMKRFEIGLSDIFYPETEKRSSQVKLWHLSSEVHLLHFMLRFHVAAFLIKHFERKNPGKKILEGKVLGSSFSWCALGVLGHDEVLPPCVNG